MPSRKQIVLDLLNSDGPVNPQSFSEPVREMMHMLYSEMAEGRAPPRLVERLEHLSARVDQFENLSGRLQRSMDRGRVLQQQLNAQYAWNQAMLASNNLVTVDDITNTPQDNAEDADAVFAREILEDSEGDSQVDIQPVPMPAPTPPRPPTPPALRQQRLERATWSAWHYDWQRPDVAEAEAMGIDTAGTFV